jgi:hypothetical protein
MSFRASSRPPFQARSGLECVEDIGELDRMGGAKGRVALAGPGEAVLEGRGRDSFHHPAVGADFSLRKLASCRSRVSWRRAPEIYSPGHLRSIISLCQNK